MGTFRITVEIADPLGQHFEAVEMLVDTGATFTKAPRDLLERLGVPVEGTYTAELADGSRVERTRPLQKSLKRSTAWTKNPLGFPTSTILWT